MTTARRAALTASFLLTAAPCAVRAATVWTAVASEKIRPDAAARATRSARISAAKNEFEAFQVVVAGPATHVSVEATPLRGPGTIADVKLYREALIDLRLPSAADGATGRFPDALVPDVDEIAGEKRNAFPFDVPAGEARAVWVEVHVPAAAAAGDYAGTVTVRAADGDSAVPVALTVWDFALPSTSSLKSAFQLSYGGLPRAHGVSGSSLTALRQRYTQLALDHRVSVSNLWDDGSQGFVDWSHVDAAWGPFLDGTAATRLAGARLTSLRSGANLASVAEHGNWAAHARARGWFDRLFQYTCDEPPITCAWGDIPARAQVARAADAGFRTLVTTDVDQARAQGVDGAIDLLTPVVNFMEDRSYATALAGPSGEARPRYDAFLSAGPRKELWLYQSCMSHGCGGSVAIGDPSALAQWWTGWPTYAVDANAVRSRAMEWLSFRYGAEGELYYETTQAFTDKADPWSDVYAFNGNGDGTLFYPGTPARIGGQTDVPVASIRLKMIREGMEDFEYLKLLSDAGGAAEAKAIAGELFPHAWGTNQTAEDLMAAREAIALRILALTGKASGGAASAAPQAGSAAPAGSGATAQGAVGVLPASIVGGCAAAPGHHESGPLAFLLVAAAFLWRRRHARRRGAAKGL